MRTLTLKESKGRTKKVKNKSNVHVKPFERDEKPWRVKDKISLTLKSYVLYASLRFFTHGVVLPKNLSDFLYFLLRFLPLFLSLSLSLSL